MPVSGTRRSEAAPSSSACGFFTEVAESLLDARLDFEQLDLAIDHLRAIAPMATRVVELRYFARPLDRRNRRAPGSVTGNRKAPLDICEGLAVS